MLIFFLTLLASILAWLSFFFLWLFYPCAVSLKLSFQYYQDAGRSLLYGINSRIITPFVYAWQIGWIVLTSGSPDTKKGRKF